MVETRSIHDIPPEIRPKKNPFAGITHSVWAFLQKHRTPSPVETPVEPTTQEKTRTLLRAPHLEPSDLQELIRNVISVRPELEKSFNTVVVSEGYTLESHTLMVMNQFESYFGENWDNPHVSKELFRAMLLLHDIGKPDGPKSMQHENTAKRMPEILRDLGFNDHEINTATQIATGTHDAIGSCLQRNISTREAANSINDVSKKLDIPLDDLFHIIMTYYMSDAGSYRIGAGISALGIFGKPSPLENVLDFTTTPPSINSRNTAVSGIFHKLEQQIARLHKRNVETSEIDENIQQTIQSAVERLSQHQEDANFEGILTDPAKTTDGSAILAYNPRNRSVTLNVRLSPERLKALILIAHGLTDSIDTKTSEYYSGILYDDINLAPYFPHISIYAPNEEFKKRIERTQQGEVKITIQMPDNTGNDVKRLFDASKTLIFNACETLDILDIFTPVDSSIRTTNLMAKQHRTEDPQEFMRANGIQPSDVSLRPTYGTYTTGYESSALARYEELAGSEIILLHTTVPHVLNQILQTGLLSQRMRIELIPHQTIAGQSAESAEWMDWKSGGGDSVFMTATTPNQHQAENVGLYPSSTYLLLDPNLLNRLDWRGYTEDKKGSTDPIVLEEYGASPEELFRSDIRYREIAMPVGIAPESIMAIIVGNNFKKEEIVDMLAEHGITHVRGIPIEEFIIVPEKPEDIRPSHVNSKRQVTKTANKVS